MHGLEDGGAGVGTHAPGAGLRMVAWALGFLVPFNLYLNPGATASVRATDVVGAISLVAGIIVLCAFRRRIRASVCLRTLGAVIAVLMWILVTTYSSRPLFIAPVRWLVGIVVGVTMWYLARRVPTREPLLMGFLAGAMLNIGVIILQVLGSFELSVALGLSTPDALAEKSFQGIWRPPGMHGDVNGTAGVISLTLPLALGLVDEHRLSRRWIVIGLGTVLAGSALTLTRSIVVTSVGVLLFWTVISERRGRNVAVVAAVALVIVGLLAVLQPPGGWERWTGEEILAQNFAVRLETTTQAAALALEHPLGLGGEYQLGALAERIGFSSSHNGFLYLALVGGIPLAGLVAFAVVSHAMSVFKFRRVEAWMALHLGALFFFEEYLRNPTFVVVAAWLLMTPAWGVWTADIWERRYD